MSNRYRDEPPIDGGCLVILLLAVLAGALLGAGAAALNYLSV